jgi:hypothetical protein
MNTFTHNSTETEVIIHMDEQQVQLREATDNLTGSLLPFDHFNAEGLDTPEDVYEMVKDWLDDQHEADTEAKAQWEADTAEAPGK